VTCDFLKPEDVVADIHYLRNLALAGNPNKATLLDPETRSTKLLKAVKEGIISLGTIKWKGRDWGGRELAQYYEALAKMYLDTLLQSGINEGETHADAINRVYRIVQVRPSHANMGIPGIPIAIPKAHFAFSEAHPNPEDPRSEHLVSITDEQMVDSRLAPTCVEWDTCTIRHGASWAGSTENLEKFMEVVDLNNGTGAYNLDAAHVETLEVINLTDLFRDFAFLKIKLKTMLTGRVDPAAVADLIRRSYIRGSFHPPNLIAAGMAKVTQLVSRYGVIQLVNGSGSTHKQEKGKKGVTVKVSEIIRFMFRSINPGFIKARQSGDKDAIRDIRRTPLPKELVVACEMIDAGDVDAGQAQLMIFLNHMLFCATLDRHVPSSVAGGHSIEMGRRSNIAILAENMHAASRDEKVKPWGTVDVEMAIDYAMSVQKEIIDLAGGDPNKSALHSYRRRDFEQAAQDRGYFSTNESYVLDMHFLNTQMGKMKTGVEDKKKH
jgi:hypothetical protein